MAQALQSFFGDSVEGKSKKDVAVESLTGEGKVVGIYFSAHWCPPCRAFTPQLAEWYKKLKSGPNESKFEIVFVSSDRDDASFKEYFAEMPWLALPYDRRDKKNDLSRKFKVSGIPTLVMVDANTGALITNDGRSIVMEDSEGNDFPWTPKPFSEVISGKFINNKEEEKTLDDLKGKVLGVYFSAHWCGPCRSFTPELIKTYKKITGDGKNFEIVFCSSDRDKDSMMEYFGSMPWLAIPFGDSRKKALSRLFEVQGIPTFVIMDENGQTITAQGRAAITGDPDGKEFPWHPKPVNELTGVTASEINEYPSLIWFTDGTKEKMDSAKKLLYPIAKQHKESEPDTEMRFFNAGENDDDDIVTSLRTFAHLSTKNPLVVIIDIPDQQVYIAEAEEINDKTLREFIEGFRKKTITGKPLRA